MHRRERKTIITLVLFNRPGARATLMHRLIDLQQDSGPLITGLLLDAGHATKSAKPDDNESVCLTTVPETERLNAHGALIALASGIPDRPSPSEAAQAAVETLNESYYSAYEGWGAQQALQESFRAANQTVIKGGERGRASSLSALLLRRRRWLVAHAGNTRVWLYRDHKITLLTRDHIQPRPAGKAYVTRACGLESSVDADVYSGELAEGDVFVLTNDGVHDLLDGTIIMSALRGDLIADQYADRLAAAALKAGGGGGACVVRVDKIPAETDVDMAENIAALPVIDPPQTGEGLDGFSIKDLVHKSSRYRLYTARDTESGENVVLKFPNPRYGQDPEYANHFLHEEWIGKRLEHPSLIRVLSPRAGRRSALYSIMAYHAGENFSFRIRRKNGFSVAETLALAGQLLDTLDYLHGRGVIHRDVRPKNLMYDKINRRPLLIGLGATHIAKLPEKRGGGRVTPSALPYTAPEYLTGAQADERTDIFSAGATLYRMLTVKYPYGKIVARDVSAFPEFTPPSRFRPQIPPWLDQVLARACAVDPADRYPNAAAFAQALADGRVSHVSAYRAHSGSRGSSAPTSAPLANPWGWAGIGVLIVGFLGYLAMILAK